MKTLIAFISALFISSFSQAQTLEIVTGYPAGTGIDRIARALEFTYQRATGNVAMVSNKPGSFGALAAQTVQNGATDGSQVLLAIGSTAYATGTFEEGRNGISIEAKYLSRLIPVWGFGTAPLVVLARSDANVGEGDNLRGTIYALEGSRLHYYALALKHQSNGRIKEVIALKGNETLALNHVNADPQNMAVVSSALAKYVVEKGNGKIVALSNKTDAAWARGAQVSSNTTGEVWYGIFAAPGTPESTVDKLWGAFFTATKDPEFVQVMESVGVARNTRQPLYLARLLEQSMTGPSTQSIYANNYVATPRPSLVDRAEVTSASAAQPSASNSVSNSRFTGKSDFSSVCMRNLYKIETELRRKFRNGRRAFAGGSIKAMEAYKAWTQVLSPCIATDPTVKKEYDELIESIRNEERMCHDRIHNKKWAAQPNMQCGEWGVHVAAPGAQQKTQPWYEFLMGQINKALNDPNYSLDVESQKSNNRSSQNSAADATCTSELNKLAEQADNSRIKVPKSETLPLMEIILWQVQEAIKVIDRYCPSNPYEVALRAELVKTNSSTQAACDGISGKGACVAQLYGGPASAPRQVGHINEPPSSQTAQETNCSSQSGANFRQCVGLICQKAGGNLTAGKGGCLTCITGKGNDFTQCVKGSSGVGSQQ